MSNRKQSFDEMIKDEFERAAEDTQKEVDESGVEHIPDSLKNSIQARLHEQIAAYEKEKIYSQLSEEDRKALELGKEMMRQQEEEKTEKKVVRKKKRLRGYLILAAALVLAMALGVTSMGGADRIIRMVTSSVGEREVVKTNSDEDNLIMAEEKEEEAWQKIGDVFGIEPVRLSGYPEKMVFQDYSIEETLLTAEILYKYNGKNIIYIINATYTDASWGIDVEDKIVDQYYIEKNGVKIEITEYQVVETEEKHIAAKFSCDSLEYFFTGTMETEEFEKIVKFLYFP